MGGEGYSFSMWQTLQMWQMLSKCILSHFATDFSAQKRTFAPKFKNHRALPGYAGGTSRSIGASPPAKITPSP